MHWECLHLGFAENFHEISVYHWISPPVSVSTILVVVPAPSANVSSPFIIDIYGVVRRNIQKPRFKTVRPWKSQALPSSTPFVSRRTGSSHSRSALLVHSSAPTTAAASCSPVQCLVPISPLAMLSTVTPSSPIQTPTLRKNVQMTSSLASWSSIAVAPSIWIYEVQPPSERTSSVAVVQVHSRGIPDGLPGPLRPLLLTLGLKSQKLNALQVDVRIPGLVPRQLLLVSSWHSVSTAAATMCTNKLTKQITYLSHPIGTVWQPSTVHSHVGIWHINSNSLRFKYMRNPLVFWECPDGPSSGNPMDP